MRGFVLLLAVTIFLPSSAAQLTTGIFEGTVCDSGGHPLAGAAIAITGAIGALYLNPNNAINATLAD